VNLSYRKRLEVAVEELSKSKAAIDWAKNNLRAYGFDPDAPEHAQKLCELALQFARKMLKKP